MNAGSLLFALRALAHELERRAGEEEMERVTNVIILIRDGGEWWR